MLSDFSTPKTTAVHSDAAQEKNLLVLCHRLPYPPNKGDRIRSWHILRHLAQRGWTIHLASLADAPEDLRHITALRSCCASVAAYPVPKWRRLLALGRTLGGASISVAYFHSDRLQKHVDQLLRTGTASAVLAISAPMAEYLRQSPSPLPRRLLLDLVDVDSVKWRDYASRGTWPLRQVYAMESRRLARYEETACRLFGQATLVSEAEADLLRPRVQADVAVVSVPNGVDTDYFSPTTPPDTPRNPVMIFCGAMDYLPNVDAATWFAETVLPLIRQRVPKARFCIAGSNPTARIRALATRPGVEVTGYVPDIRPLLEAAALSVAPMRIARGVQNKVLEAMAMGKAVVVTPQALEGISAAPGVHLEMAPDIPEAFAHASTSLLLDAARRAALERQARDLVVRDYAWESQLAPLPRLLA